jgi:uncharacterized protein (DUF2336 family)
MNDRSALATSQPGEERMDYAVAKRLAADQDPSVRQNLAARSDVQPEVLYFLAEDEQPEVRRQIAANVATPRQADLILARDDDDEVRVSIARKIARLAPQLKAGERDWLQQMTVQILEQLARDQLPRVRTIIAEEVRALDNIPPPLVRELARDVEITVCGPILRFSPLLTDDHLLEIIRSDPVQGALSAIAQREELSEAPSAAIAESGDETAVADLLANPSAQIREETLDRIIDDAPRRVAWHKPLVKRKDLSLGAVKRVAQFVTASLLAELEKRHSIDPDMTKEVANNVSRRLSSDGLNEEGTPEVRAKKAYDSGKLDDAAMCAALERGDREFAAHALALKTKLDFDVVQRILATPSPIVVVSLCWKASLSMRTAFQVQLKATPLAPTDVVNAREGVHYPFSGSEMREALRLYGV